MLSRGPNTMMRYIGANSTMVVQKDVAKVP